MSAVVERLKEAWRNRHALGDKENDRTLNAFLPSALEIQETPPNPLTRWLAKSIIVLLVIGVIWSIYGEVNIVASAEGKILPGSRVKVIQPLQKGVVKTILVREGEYVNQGQPLVELDSTLTGADVSKLKHELLNAEMKMAVNLALLKRLKNKENLSNELANIDQSDGDSPRYLYFNNLLQEKWIQIKANELSLINAKEAIEAEYKATKIELEKLRKTLPIAEKRVSIVKGLHKKQFATEIEFLQLEQERIQQTHQLAAEKQKLKQLEATKKQSQQKIKFVKAETRANLLAEITEYRREVSSLQQELEKANDINKRQVLYAPVSGHIQELGITTHGGVVTDAQSLMKIVPDEDRLIVEVLVENKDIGFIKKNMSAEIKIHTFPFTKYGVIEAEVKNISDDAIIDEKRGLLYGLLLEMSKKNILVNGVEVRLLPGMQVTAEMKIGKRRLIEYFLSPLLRHGKESLRER
ncbi:MAG: HlyD family type I secretion periplasmic adaptor subunit [Candidatus Thiodiazotropha taylori]|nr:HlyD family type I secretion periplasmic adaptor subunit [Candidatus Thiodiazotropha taylori]MCG7971346.1 HlyD family type I secretion periplasmic adaptor subunit [Candidatus Thiodiazotropha taylori]